MADFSASFVHVFKDVTCKIIACIVESGNYLPALEQFFPLGNPELKTLRNLPDLKDNPGGGESRKKRKKINVKMEVSLNGGVFPMMMKKRSLIMKMGEKIFFDNDFFLISPTFQDGIIMKY